MTRTPPRAAPARPRRAPTPLALAAALCLAAACGHPWANLPVSEQARPSTRQNARLRGSAPPVAASVTYERILRAREEPRNWLTYFGTYDGQRFSALAQVDTSNVKRLRPAWIFQQGVLGLIASPATYAMEASPIVVDGVMFVSGYDGWVWALDAATGETLWQYHHPTPVDVPLCCGNVNRGVAVAEGKVFFASANAHLVALDAVTGRPVWETVFADVKAGESATGAPLVVRNLVLVGSAGGEYGVRGHIDAMEVATGRRVWRRYNVPAPGEPGSETWPAGSDAWTRGGGTSWTTGTYDAELDLVYWGTSNPGPDFDGSVRPGDNLYTSSIVAFRPGDGRLVWHYQTTPHDVWDYDAISEPILFDRGGRRLVAQFNKNGHLYVLDRADGRPVHVTPYARVTWADVDERTGAVTVKLTPSREGTRICPGLAGAKEWNHAAYHPGTGLLYAPVIELCATYFLAESDFEEGLQFWGGSFMPDPQGMWGEVKAVDPATGRIAWSWRDPHPVVSSVLATAGGLVFVGRASGELAALHARTGELLWQFQTGSGIHGSPVTYSVGGKQYVAVPSGWGAATKGFAPEMAAAPRGASIVVFSLP
ncbi:MAG TPA: PQQ-dependent dehydrogenase, methanol/ethanol family [Longimicrobium sp.]|jgi:alcohol dehydrogenase (cytochrome c)